MSSWVSCTLASQLMAVLCQGVPMKSGPMGRLMTVHTEGQRRKDELNLN